MKPIIFNDETDDEIEVGLTPSKSYVTITGCAGAVYVNVYSIDKLIEVLYLIKEEL